MNTKLKGYKKEQILHKKYQVKQLIENRTTINQHPAAHHFAGRRLQVS